MRVCAQCRIVVKWTKRERRTATPAAHHLRRHQLLSLWSIRVRLKKSTKFRNALVQLSEDYVRSISSENFGRGLLSTAHLIGVAEYELAGFERLFLRITSRDTAPLDRRVANA